MILIIISILLGVAALLYLLLYLFPIITIAGDSMYPTFVEGERVIGSRLFDKTDCKEGRIYVIHLRDDENGEPYLIIKRLYRKVFSEKDNEFYYYFLGDNRKVSADSRVYGLFSSDRVVAEIIGKKGKR